MSDAMKVFLGVLIFGVVYFGAKAAIQNTAPQYDFTPSDRITVNERTAFMNACVGEGADAAYCRCTLDHLEDNNTPDEIRAMNGVVTPDYLPPEMWEAVYACQHLIN